MKKIYIFLFIFSLIAMQPATGQRKLLDKTFGNNGLVVTRTNNFNEAWGLAIQKDGKIVMSGVDWNYNYSSDQGLFLRRFEKNGRVDKTFGNEGVVIVSLPTSGSGFSMTLADVPVALQEDGKIILGGGDFFVQRYNTDGSLDRTFQHPLYSGFSRLNDLAVQPDGKVIAVGTVDEFAIGGMLIKRFNADGRYDSTFGVDGKMKIEFRYLESATAYAVQLLPDGSYLIGGKTGSFSQVEMALVKLKSDGQIDKSFGNDGMVITVIPDNPDTRYGSINDLELQADGRIVAGATAQGATRNYATILRYLPDGRLDSSFNGVGYVRDPNAQSSCWAVIIDEKGRITGGGGTMISPYPAKLNRYDKDGKPNISVEINPDGNCFALAIQDGKIVAAGYHQPSYYIRALAMGRFSDDTGLSQPVAVRESEVKIYPNPVVSMLKVESDDLLHSTVTITDVSGNIRYRSEAKANSLSINVQQFPRGMYQLSIEKQGHILSRTFMKE